MSVAVCAGALLKCSFGNAPAMLVVTKENKVETMTPFATVDDYVPIKNITTFVMCKSPTNPVVIAATIKNYGVLQPMPCIPNVTSAWKSGAPTVKIAGKKALNRDSTCDCLWGGKIKIDFPGQLTVLVP